MAIGVGWLPSVGVVFRGCLLMYLLTVCLRCCNNDSILIASLFFINKLSSIHQPPSPATTGIGIVWMWILFIRRWTLVYSLYDHVAVNEFPFHSMVCLLTSNLLFAFDVYEGGIQNNNKEFIPNEMHKSHPLVFVASWSVLSALCNCVLFRLGA